MILVFLFCAHNMKNQALMIFELESLKNLFLNLMWLTSLPRVDGERLDFIYFEGASIFI